VLLIFAPGGIAGIGQKLRARFSNKGEA
jgi:hypothetical protein